MIRTRQELEEQERQILAPWAQKSADSAGRSFRERRHPHRTEYQRDRARIIHSRAFRRLEYKTQVFLTGMGDHLRTRLTHTFEVANISRTIARALALNEDLAEAIALAHDLGHPPFGHGGEEMLNELMRDHGGFDHNAQSLRIVDLIESRYPKFPGLNLSHEVREGLQKHARFYRSSKTDAVHPQPAMEAQVTNLADEITYYSHDLDDGLDFQLLTPEQLEHVNIWRDTQDEVRRHFPRLKGVALSSVDEVRAHPEPLVAYSRGLLRDNQQLRRFLYKNLYFHPRVAEANQRACELLRDVFLAYLKNPKLLGQATARRMKEGGLHRTVCDYISGMTDRYLLDEHVRLCTRRAQVSLPKPIARRPGPKAANGR
jgi:dGTPase